ncbi:MAG: 6-carboxytetrahydropterin synthase [candidate division KSB1 bacterium]|nr:6-carboxytetrahydropterin synthase [candidate division KSB1 bacterium]
MYTLTVKSGFSAAHRLVDYPGDCKRIHGHNYKVSLSIQAMQTQ